MAAHTRCSTQALDTHGCVCYFTQQEQETETMKAIHYYRVAPGSYKLGSWVINYFPALRAWVAYDTSNPLAADKFYTLREAVAAINATIGA